MITNTSILFMSSFGIILTALEWQKLKQSKKSIMILRILVLNIPALLLINLLLLEG